MRREPRDSSIPVPRFQKGGGILKHTGGTSVHGGMMDYTRFPISEMHQGKFPDSMEFQSWKVNSKTEVCSKTSYPHLTMHWIKEVEMAKSIDELVTSRSSLERTDFPDYDMLGAMIASALKKAAQHACALPAEQRAQKVRAILTRGATCSRDLQAFSCNRS